VTGTSQKGVVIRHPVSILARLAAPAEIPPDRVWVGPVDETPGAELVTAESLGEDDAGLRKEMKQAREPRNRATGCGSIH
jgi:hypothetical protein